MILDPWFLNLNGQKQLPDGQKARERTLNIVVTGETQIQATVRHPFTPIKMAITKLKKKKRMGHLGGSVG